MPYHEGGVKDKFQHIQHIFHIQHILHSHILHILQERHKLSVMDGWQENMLGQEGANADPAAVPASAAGPAWITSDAVPTCLLQYAEYSKEKMQNMQENMQNMTKNMQANTQNMTKNMFEYAQYAIWYTVAYCDIFFIILHIAIFPMCNPCI